MERWTDSPSVAGNGKAGVGSWDLNSRAYAVCPTLDLSLRSGLPNTGPLGQNKSQREFLASSDFSSVS